MLDALAPDRPWTHAATLLLATAADDLEVGAAPLPTLAAYRGDEPLAITTLRPFGAGELLQALVEVLALLIPLGADRVALSVTGRAWSLDDPITPVDAEVDLRARVLLLTLADAHDGACATRTEIHPFEQDADGWCFGPPLELGDHRPESGIDDALASLLDGRGDLVANTTDQMIAAQLGRVLLLGHRLALAPDTAADLEGRTGR